jgi:hypothetical protein
MGKPFDETQVQPTSEHPIQTTTNVNLSQKNPKNVKGAPFVPKIKTKSITIASKPSNQSHSESERALDDLSEKLEVPKVP